MLGTIEKGSQIKKSQKEFEKIIGVWAQKRSAITIGGKGFHGPEEVSWSGKLGIWWTTYSVENRAP
jgi:hypothetical protein